LTEDCAFEQGSMIANGRYRIDKVLGRGGMGVVYLALDNRLNRSVAIKVISSALSRQPDLIARFEREAKVMASLNHPNIVQIHDYGDHEGRLFLIMEHVEGTSLDELFRQGGRLNPDTAIRLIRDLLFGLSHAHARGIIHRDLKPSNLIVFGDPQSIKIADFGIAKILRGETGGNSLTVGEGMLGTPYYMAPEQRINPSAADARADIYAAGVVLYEMLVGRVPHGIPQRPSEVLSLSPGMDEVIFKALSDLPERRYGSAGEFSEALLGCLVGPASPTPQPSVTKTVPLPKKRLMAVIVLTLVLTVLSWFGGIKHLIALSAKIRGYSSTVVLEHLKSPPWAPSHPDWAEFVGTAWLAEIFFSGLCCLNCILVLFGMKPSRPIAARAMLGYLLIVCTVLGVWIDQSRSLSQDAQSVLIAALLILIPFFFFLKTHPSLRPGDKPST
jgi:serine/threonine protein kinase